MTCERVGVVGDQSIIRGSAMRFLSVVTGCLRIVPFFHCASQLFLRNMPAMLCNSISTHPSLPASVSTCVGAHHHSPALRQWHGHDSGSGKASTAPCQQHTQQPVVRDLFPVSESSSGGCAVVAFAVFLAAASAAAAALCTTCLPAS